MTTNVREFVREDRFHLRVRETGERRHLEEG